MFIMPDFVHSNEEWIIWLLGEEFNGKATLDMVAERTHIPKELAERSIERLEQQKTVSVIRDPETKLRVISLGLTPTGKMFYGSIQKRKETV